MVFVRIKKLKGREYAYLVANEWTINGSRQKVKGYLGRVVTPVKQKETSVEIASLDYKSAVLALVKQELLNHGFSEELTLEDIKADISSMTFIKKGKNIVLALNEGFLCTQTVKDALEVELNGYEERAGMQLAKALLGTGLNIPKDTFVQLFEKIYKGNMNIGE